MIGNSGYLVLDTAGITFSKWGHSLNITKLAN